jgi:hypothetical protein
MRDVPPGIQGNVQGLDWYTSSMQVDADGDSAIEFYVENTGVARGKDDEEQPGSKYQKRGPTLAKQPGIQPAKPAQLSVTGGNVTLTP